MRHGVVIINLCTAVVLNNLDETRTARAEALAAPATRDDLQEGFAAIQLALDRLRKRMEDMA